MNSLQPAYTKFHSNESYTLPQYYYNDELVVLSDTSLASEADSHKPAKMISAGKANSQESTISHQWSLSSGSFCLLGLSNAFK